MFIALLVFPGNIDSDCTWLPSVPLYPCNIFLWMKANSQWHFIEKCNVYLSILTSLSFTSQPTVVFPGFSYNILEDSHWCLEACEHWCGGSFVPSQQSVCITHRHSRPDRTLTLKPLLQRCTSMSCVHAFTRSCFFKQIQNYFHPRKMQVKPKYFF